MEDKIAWDKMTLPRAGFIERILGDHYRKRAGKFIVESIKNHATLEDGRTDDELADYIRKKLTQRTEVSIQRDVVEPAGWVFASGAIAGVTALAVTKHLHNKILVPTTVFATVSGTAVGAVLDLYRMNRRFDSAMHGALKGALRAMQEERGPMAEKHRREDPEYRSFDLDMDDDDRGKGGGYSR